MIVQTEALKSICSKILTAVDSNEISTITETLELICEQKILEVNVTNKEYFVKVKVNVDTDECFYASVNANLFLKLIAQITTDTIELIIKDTYLIVKGNGTYKLPLIFDNDKLLRLTPIEINNITTSFNISSDILNSLLYYNSKEIAKVVVSKPVQKLYYIDDQGAITFTSGACVNNFTLPYPVKLLFNNRLVKLFKLFKDEDVKFTLGHDSINESIIQTKVRFETDSICITAILPCDDTLINSVPVQKIRDRANNIYPYSITINKNALTQSINRLLLFSSGLGDKENIKPYGTFQFYNDYVTIHDSKRENKEDINYSNTISIDSNMYELVIDLTDLKSILDTCNEDYINLHFGDDQAIVVIRANIRNIIPQVRVR